MYTNNKLYLKYIIYSKNLNFKYNITIQILDVFF